MRCAPALPIFQLMPAVGSRIVPVATSLLGGLPGEIERPHTSPARTSGTPSIIMSPDHCPRTQIRLGAGTRNVVCCIVTFSHGRQQMT
jgi:hypothetical protein